MSVLYPNMLADGHAEQERLVHVEREAGYAIVRLDDPRRLNVLSAGLVVQLRDALSSLADDPEVRAIVLTGADPGFSTGGDLRMMERAIEQISRSDDEAGTTDIWRWIRYQFGGIVRLIARTDKAFVAALNGPAAGVGLAFALTCDIAIASERALIVPAFGRLGLLPEVGTSWALTRALGYQGAFRFYAAGEHLDAERALELGLVSEVVPHDELLPTARVWCERIAELPPHAIAMTKPLLRGAADMTWDHALATEEFAEPSCFTTREFGEAVQALLKRPAAA